jgi:hypothetical protein
LEFPRASSRASSIPISRLTAGRGGSGLGLAIVEGLVEAHGGRVSVESEEGQGSCFVVVCPAEAGRPRTPRGKRMSTGRALVVDDDPGILEVLEMRLESMGLDVTLAQSYRDAVLLLDGKGFDVALFDLRMEPVSGLKLMEAAHQRQPRLPVSS